MSPGGRLALVVGGLGCVLVAVAVGALFVGSAGVPPGSVVAVLFGRDLPEPVARVVVLDLRLPRIAVAALAGGALAVAGASLQALTRNPLAEPSVLGVSSGAAFGVVTGQLFGLGTSMLASLGLTVFAFAGAFVAGGAVYLSPRVRGGLPSTPPAGRGHRGHLLLVRDHGADLAGGHQPAGRHHPVAAGQCRAGGAGGPGRLRPGGGGRIALILADARRLNLLALGEDAAQELG